MTNQPAYPLNELETSIVDNPPLRWLQQALRALADLYSVPWCTMGNVIYTTEARTHCMSSLIPRLLPSFCRILYTAKSWEPVKYATKVGNGTTTWAFPSHSVMSSHLTATTGLWIAVVVMCAMWLTTMVVTHNPTTQSLSTWMFDQHWTPSLRHGTEWKWHGGDGHKNDVEYLTPACPPFIVCCINIPYYCNQHCILCAVSGLSHPRPWPKMISNWVARLNLTGLLLCRGGTVLHSTCNTKK